MLKRDENVASSAENDAPPSPAERTRHAAAEKDGTWKRRGQRERTEREGYERPAEGWSKERETSVKGIHHASADSFPLPPLYTSCDLSARTTAAAARAASVGAFAAAAASATCSFLRSASAAASFAAVASLATRAVSSSASADRAVERRNDTSVEV